jgi:hypothetical protein
VSEQTQSTLRTIALMMLSCCIAGTAFAGPNEITLQRFGDCVPSTEDCRGVQTREAEFRDFANELGLAFAPLGVAPAETLGAAGFDLQIEHSATFINSNEEYWDLAMKDGEAPSSVQVSQLHLRKGLPFSFEVGAMTSVWWGSDLVAFGGEFKWALHEDTAWPVPDLAIRGWGNVVLGSQQLRLYNAGADVVVSLPFGIGGAVQLTPFLGYSLHAVISGSNIMDASPGDPRPPFERPDGSSGVGNQPEFVFDTETQINNRIFGGLRLRVTHLELTVQVTGLSDVLTVTGGIGATF